MYQRLEFRYHCFGIQYRVIGKLKDDILLLLFEYIETELKEDPKLIIDNLKA